MKHRTVFLVCNAHLDPVWLWEWEEGVAATLSTFRVAADICDESDGFVFNHNEALLYQWVEEYEPALFGRIQRLVRQGKWHIMGGWYLQPDCNMPSGESFVRQILTGRSYFSEKFGVFPTTAINFDPFGHTQGLVQILAKSGYDSYLFCRPDQAFCPLPADTFTWVGYDGSEILATRSESYNSLYGQAREKVEKYIRSHEHVLSGLVLWGIGNHGGGPSRLDLQALDTLCADTTDVTLRHATPEAYFAEARRDPDLPRHVGDINPWAVGCYTSQVRIKQKHRQLENALYRLEKMSVSACANQLLAYPAQEIQSALYDLLFCQFHDILPGSSIQPVEEYSLQVLDHGLEAASRLTTRCFFALAAGQPVAREGEIPVLVYNPHPFPVTAVVECEFQLADQNWSDSWTIPHVYRGDEKLPSQLEKEESNLNLDWRKRVAFLAELLPGQMNRFDCRLEAGTKNSLAVSSDAPKLIRVQTDDLEVCINVQTGLMDTYRVHNCDCLKSGSFSPLVMADTEDSWGMLVRRFDMEAGAFSLMSPEDSARFSGVRGETLPPVRIVEEGDVRTVVEAVFSYAQSSLCLRYKIPKKGTEVEIEARVFWNEKDKFFKLSLYPIWDDAEYIGQVAYGVGSLPAQGDEAVAQKWVSVLSRTAGKALTVINEGTYGSDFSKKGLRLSLLRSPAYSGHPILDHPIMPQDRFMPRIDQGERVFRFWLNAGPLDERLQLIDREALAKNEIPIIRSFFPSGEGKRTQAFLKLSDDVMQVNAIKKAEKGDDWIVRLFEPTGQSRATTLHFPLFGNEIPITLKPFEICTLRISGTDKTVSFCDLLERPLETPSDAPISSQGNYL